jgi:hypothetical protein
LHNRNFCILFFLFWKARSRIDVSLSVYSVSYGVSSNNRKQGSLNPWPVESSLSAVWICRKGCVTEMLDCCIWRKFLRNFFCLCSARY